MLATSAVTLEERREIFQISIRQSNNCRPSDHPEMPPVLRHKTHCIHGAGNAVETGGGDAILHGNVDRAVQENLVSAQRHLAVADFSGYQFQVSGRDTSHSAAIDLNSIGSFQKDVALWRRNVDRASLGQQLQTAAGGDRNAAAGGHQLDVALGSRDSDIALRGRNASAIAAGSETDSQAITSEVTSGRRQLQVAARARHIDALGRLECSHAAGEDGDGGSCIDGETIGVDGELAVVQGYGGLRR